jgi:hypothetical protein
MPSRTTRASVAPKKAPVPKKPANAGKAPLSETVLHKDPTPRTAEACIEILKAIALAEPEKVITRNYFRNKSPITESVWNAHFGTFEEFKRQAGIILTRQQHNLERQIAKHASVDHYRAVAAERSEWGERYLRPNKKRWQMGMFVSDLHDEEIDPFFRRVMLDTLKRAQPEVFSIVGDGMDLPEFGKYTVDPRQWGPVRRIKFFRDQIVRPAREAAPEAQIDLIEGNHEYRILRHFADETPALRAVLAELHDMDVRKLFKLDEFNVNWVGKADLAAYTEKDVQKELRNNYRIYWDSFLAYHYPDGRSWGMPGVNGHHHSHIVWPNFSPVYGAYEWHQMGCGHRRDASYCVGEKWHMGFALVHVDTHTRSQVIEYVPIADHAVVGGKLYVREPHEFVNRPLISPLAVK